MTSAKIRARVTAVIAVAMLFLTGCANAVSGSGEVAPLAPDAHLNVVGAGSDPFDQVVENSINDVIDFWQLSYPTVSDGKTFPKLEGKLYSVDGAVERTAADLENACLHQEADAVVDNAFYCQLDDSVAWDRAQRHLVPMLAAKYGDFLATMVFAHEFGHVVQKRLGLFDKTNISSISLETQADCAAGAFVGWAMRLQAPHFHPTVDEV
ncbi:MAG: neutral zinc metallopeptidase, partial [Actinomycetia bacterium]|nr:neutral zinc metallopeptidase [Actinomycetes bacterium]